MTAIDNANLYLDKRINEQRANHGVPGLSAVLVRDGGDTIVARARGIRKWDVDHNAPANWVQHDDRFPTGSITKTFTGYLMAYLVQTGVLKWTTTIGEVFPEFSAPAFATRYGVRASYLGKTLEQLMTHNADLQKQPSSGQEIVFSIHNAAWLADEYSTLEAEVLRRYNYVATSLQDAPEPMPGSGVVYGGGSIICAAMAERRTGESYEALLQKHVYDKLGMTRSGIGRTATSAAPDGVWWHHSQAGGAPVPDGWYTSKAASAHSHNPAGGVCTTAHDMGLFIAANLPGSAKTVVSDASLAIAQARPALAETLFARGGWYGDPPVLEHNGATDDLYYAYTRVYPAHDYGIAAMASTGGTAGNDAVMAMLSILEEMHSQFGLFG